MTFKLSSKLLIGIFVSIGLYVGLINSTLAEEVTSQQQADVFQAPENLASVRPVLLCRYYYQQSPEEQKRFYDRVDSLGLLSHRDYEAMPEGKTEVGSSLCGMYMTKGEPIFEDGVQIRPMVFKVVHVYEDEYIVTQSGMVMEIHTREEGKLPPSLNQGTPEVAPPPLAPHAR